MPGGATVVVYPNQRARVADPWLWSLYRDIDMRSYNVMLLILTGKYACINTIHRYTAAMSALLVRFVMGYRFNNILSVIINIPEGTL